jgi:hypothetical protein
MLYPAEKECARWGGMLRDAGIQKNTEQVINISLYNAYNRNNPAYLAVDIIQDKDKNGKKDQLIIRKRGKSIYGIIPSISYSFKF